MEDELIYYSILFELYGNTFTNKQKDTFEKYVNEDYSLSEIAEFENISRQAVSDNILKCKQKLEQLENELGLFKKKKSVEELVNKIENRVTELNSGNLEQKQKEIKTLLDKLKNI